MRVLNVLKIAVVLCGVFFAVEAWRTHNADQRLAAPLKAQQVFAPEPVQTSTRATAFSIGEYQIKPVADFSVRARILGREDYRMGREADLSPIDLALGWKRMADPTVYKPLNITQGGRWYRYTWSDQPPIPLQEIIESSSNMHMIPASPAVGSALEKAQEGRYIRLTGKLVNVQHASGWRWSSSLSRVDSGAGACELVYVESAVVE